MTIAKWKLIVALVTVAVVAGGVTFAVTKNPATEPTPMPSLLATSSPSSIPSPIARAESSAETPDVVMKKILDTQKQFKTDNQNPYLTANFVALYQKQVQASRQNPGSVGGANPYNCAQNEAPRTFGRYTINGDSATGSFTEQYDNGANTVTYNMKLVSGVWKLDSNSCVK